MRAAPVPVEAALGDAIRFFEALTPADLDRLGDVYTDDAAFKDPFNEVRGLAAIRGVYQHMFDRLDGPRFVVQDRIAQDGQAFITWDFVFAFRGERVMRTIRGATQFRFADDGRIAVHRDYWDAAEELYEKLPVLGGLMRWLKRRAAGG